MFGRYSYKGRHHKSGGAKHRAPKRGGFVLGLPTGFGKTGMVSSHRRGMPRLFR